MSSTQSDAEQLYDAVQNGKELENALLSEGQPNDWCHPLILNRDDEADEVIAVVKNDITKDRVAGYCGTRKEIIKGKCGHCGSNRLEHSVLEPAGEVFIGCPVCKRSNSNMDDFEYERGEE